MASAWVSPCESNTHVPPGYLGLSYFIGDTKNNLQLSFGHLHQKQWSPLPSKQPAMDRLHKLQEHPLIQWDGAYKKKNKNKKTQTKTEEKHNAVHHPSHGNQRKAKKTPKQNKTSHPSLWILCGDWGQLYYGSINCLIYLHYNTQVTLARHLLPGYVSENTIDVQQHVYIWHPPPWRRGDMGERCIKHRRGSSIGAAKPTHRQCIFQGGTAKDGNRSTTKSLAKSQMAHLWNRPLPPSTSFLESTFYFHGRSPPSTFLDTLEVRSQKGDAGPFHHPSDAQKAQGQQPEG